MDNTIMIRDKNGRFVELDISTNALMTLDYAHHEAHAGSAYRITVSGDDIRDTVLRLTFTTPNTAKWMHVIFSGSSSGAATFKLVEGVTFGGSGTANAPALNRNRNSANTSGVISELSTTAGQITTDAAAATGGTTLIQEEMGSGKDKVGGLSRDDAEFILDQNSNYEVTLIGGADNVVGALTMSWYEHTDKN